MPEEVVTQARCSGAGRRAPAPGPSLVPERVAQVAARRGAAVAVIGPEATYTYRELDQAADRIAARLRTAGVGRGSLVGVFVSRSARMVVALLGVLRAGAAYVPLDPAYPRQRVRLMLEDARCAALLTTADLAAALPTHDAQVLLLDGGEQPGNVEPAEGAATPDDLAYVIYTSGSTGRPKGVMIEHRALANLLASMSRQPGLTQDDVLVAVTTLSFDIAALELLLPLYVGGTVVVAAREVTVDPEALAAALDRHRATVLQATPATWRMLVDAGWAGRPGLRALCGGEALPPSLAAALLGRGLELWNMYGPTETTIWSLVQRLHDAADPIPIGVPIAGTEVFVVDRSGRPVPTGAVGELLIGGVGLARGYLDRPALTAERFVRLDLAGGRRVYRTGDLVRSRADGSLTFVGRIDSQVKIRGFRVELGEVESALRADGAVSDAAVVVREDAPGDRRLVGYVTPRPGAAPDAARLRAQLRISLPAHMVPAAVVVLDALPRTPNGKLDRTALPPPGGVDAGRRGDRVGPRDALEAELVDVWQRALRFDDIGVDDDFFDLGVDSLTAARLFTEIERRYPGRLPLAPVFSAPTVARLATVLRDPVSRRRFTCLIPMSVTPAAPSVFCVHGGAGTVLLYEPLARRLAPTCSTYALQAAGLYGGTAIDVSVEEMAQRYLREIRQVQPHGPYALAGYCFGGLVAFEMARRLLAVGERVSLVAMLSAPSPSYLRTYHPVFDEEGRWERPPARRRRGLRQRAVRKARSVEFRAALRLRLPLPAHLRAARFFTVVAARAERRYDAAPAGFPLLVIAGDGLYDAADLGWSAYTTAGIEAVTLDGGQRVPRDLMREPHAAAVADHLLARLAAIARERVPEGTP